METPSPPRWGRLRPTLVLATLSAASGSAFQYGYNLAEVNTPHKVLKVFYNDTYFERHGTSVGEKDALLLWSGTVSMFPLGGVLGSLVVGSWRQTWQGTWRLAGALGTHGGPQLLQLLSLPFFPESPRYTLIQKGMRTQHDKLISVIVLMAGQQLPSISTVRGVGRAACVHGGGPPCSQAVAVSAPGLLLWINYPSDMIYASAGGEAAHSHHMTVGSGVVHVVMTVVLAVTVECLGRWCLLLVGCGICSSACLTLSLALLPGPVPSVVRTEIFLKSSWPAAFMVDGAVHWLTDFIVGFVFPYTLEAIGAHSFLVFACICLLTAVCTSMVIPRPRAEHLWR